MLITPIQRIPRYVLLLSDLLKQTDKQHPDYKNIEKTIISLEETTSHINKRAESAKNSQMVFEMQEKISDAFIVQPNRRFLKEGDVLEIGEKIKPRKFFLFNDILVITNQHVDPKTGKHKFVAQVSLKHFSCAKFANEIDGAIKKKIRFRKSNLPFKKEKNTLFYFQVFSRNGNFSNWAVNDESSCFEWLSILNSAFQEESINHDLNETRNKIKESAITEKKEITRIFLDKSRKSEDELF